MKRNALTLRIKRSALYGVIFSEYVRIRTYVRALRIHIHKMNLRYSVRNIIIVTANLRKRASERASERERKKKKMKKISKKTSIASSDVVGSIKIF